MSIYMSSVLRGVFCVECFVWSVSYSLVCDILIQNIALGEAECTHYHTCSLGPSAWLLGEGHPLSKSV